MPVLITAFGARIKSAPLAADRAASGLALPRSAPAIRCNDADSVDSKLGCTGALASPIFCMAKPSLIVPSTLIVPAARTVRSTGAPLNCQFKPLTEGSACADRSSPDRGSVSAPGATISTPASTSSGVPLAETRREAMAGAAADMNVPIAPVKF